MTESSETDVAVPGQLGRVCPPYNGRTNCTVDTCQRMLDEVEGAFVFQDLESGKLVIVCGVCAVEFELNHRGRFMLLAL